jgi:hypothetical protein
MKIEYSFDFDVTIDPYRASTGGLSSPRLYLHFSDDVVRVILSQEYPGQTGIDPTDYLDVGIEFTEEMPDESELEDYLRSDEAQKLIKHIHNGYDIGWTGGHPGDGWRCAVLDEVAQSAVAEMESAIAELPRSEIVTWACDEWFSQTIISESTTAEEIADYIANPTDDANIRLADDIEEYLLGEWKHAIENAIQYDDINDHDVVSHNGNIVVINHSPSRAVVTVVVDDDDEIVSVEKIELPKQLRRRIFPRQADLDSSYENANEAIAEMQLGVLRMAREINFPVLVFGNESDLSQAERLVSEIIKGSYRNPERDTHIERAFPKAQIEAEYNAAIRAWQNAGSKASAYANPYNFDFEFEWVTRK